jgi:hypothetical protein
LLLSPGHDDSDILLVIVESNLGIVVADDHVGELSANVISSICTLSFGKTGLGGGRMG